MIPPELVEQAAACVREGGVLLYPTETVYGLGGDPAREAVVRRIRALKGRDADKPMLVLTDDWARVERWIAAPTDLHRRLMAVEPPLPLTLLFEPGPEAPPVFRGAARRIGIRRTADPFCRAVVARAGRPLLSTSANPAGEPPPARFEAIHPAIRGAVDLAVDAGRPLAGVPSTVADVSAGALVIVRPGAVSEVDLRALL